MGGVEDVAQIPGLGVYALPHLGKLEALACGDFFYWPTTDPTGLPGPRFWPSACASSSGSSRSASTPETGDGDAAGSAQPDGHDVRRDRGDAANDSCEGGQGLRFRVGRSGGEGGPAFRVDVEDLQAQPSVIRLDRQADVEVPAETRPWRTTLAHGSGAIRGSGSLRPLS
ncbi:hypothetical protein TNCT1_63140 [Streptomyces sp. 1-11]|nr:hypothetical protein TNCT1_63140 [Streptomyces sp. 1-11]